MLSEKDIQHICLSHGDKLSRIKVCLFDIDGVLTDSMVRFDGNEMAWNRSFNTRDGYGMKMLMQAGIKVGVVTGGDSLGIEKRFVENLKIDYFYSGSEDKRNAYNAVKSNGFSDEQILFMGDEFFDLPVLKQCGFSATVPNASYEIKEKVDYVSKLESGQGCAREVIDILRYAQKIMPEIEY